MSLKLKEITEPQIFDPPKRMLVWDCDRPYFTDDIPNLNKPKVIAILPKVFANKIVLAINYDNTYSCYAHCAEIPEKPKPRRATFRELEKWLAQGNGEMKVGNLVKHYFFDFNHYESDFPAFETWKVRKWEDHEWREPTIDYLGINENELQNNDKKV